MGCKSCKSKKMGEKISSEFTKTSSYVNDSLHQRKMEILKKSWDTSMGSFKLSEKIILIFLAWIPLIVGYFSIGRFIISLF